MPLPKFHEGPRNRSRDRWVLRHVPISFLEYPFESALSVWGLIAGVQVAFDVATPSVSDLPRPLPFVWAILMLGGGIYVAWGLHRRSYAAFVASGITVIGYVLAAYAAAILAFTPDWRRSVTVMSLLVAISIVAFMRAWWLRARDDLIASSFGNGGNGSSPRPGSNEPGGA